MRTFKILFMSLLSCLSLLPGVRCMAQVEMLYLKSMPDTVLPQMQLQKANPALGARHVKTMPAFDLQKLLEEDKQRDELREAVRYGKAFDVSYTLKDGEWKDVEGGRLWGMQVASPGARLLTFFIEDISLPDSAYIFIVNDDASVLYGNITGKILNKERCVLTDFIPGSKATVYLFEPAKYKGLSKFRISRVVHGFRDIATGGNAPDPADESLESGASSCNIDVACKPAYADEANAVAMIYGSNGVAFGTGSLLMTQDKSFEPYLLTAFHILDYRIPYNFLIYEERDAPSCWGFKFKYRLASCSGTTLDNSITFTGANFVAAWERSNTDFALLKLKGRVKDIPSMYYLGWDNSGATPTSGVCIHHPKGDVMKISIENNSFQTSCWTGAYPSATMNHWKVYFDEGITEEKSSGSPILDQNRRVVGQFHGGVTYDNPCDNTDAYFGKLSLSWLGDSTYTGQLKHWLDPDDTGATTMNGSYAPGLSATIVGDPVLCSSNSYTLTGVPPIYTIDWSLSNNSDFLLLTSGDSTCYVGSMTNAETTVFLTARVYYGSMLIKTVTQPLYRHAAPVVTGNQNIGYGSGHYFPAHDPIVYVNDSITGISGYEVSPCGNIMLVSDAFRGMQLGYYGATPYDWEHNNNVLTFSLPYQSTPYSFHITGTSSGHCSDFNIPLRVDPTEIPQVEGGLTPYIEGGMLRIHFGYESLVTDPQVPLPEVGTWQLTACRLGSSVITYNALVEGEDALIPLSTFLSGYYYVFRGLAGSEVFTCTVLIP